MVKYQQEGRLSSDATGYPVPRLYVIPGSHACRSAMLMLEHKGMPWKTVEFIPGMQTATMRALGFPGRTVPAIKLDGERVQTNRRIARFLDELEPDPVLIPPHRRTAVETAEAFADEILQTLARRLVLAAGRRDLSLLAEHGDSGRLGAALAPGRGRRRLIMRLAARHFGVTEATEAFDLAALPAALDRIDALLEQGVLNGPLLNAADFETAPSLALLAYRLDLRSEVETRASWRLVERLLPGPDGGSR